jgi:hypothetical protein
MTRPFRNIYISVAALGFAGLATSVSAQIQSESPLPRNLKPRPTAESFGQFRSICAAGFQPSPATYSNPNIGYKCIATMPAPTTVCAARLQSTPLVEGVESGRRTLTYDCAGAPE